MCVVCHCHHVGLFSGRWCDVRHYDQYVLISWNTLAAFKLPCVSTVISDSQQIL